MTHNNHITLIFRGLQISPFALRMYLSLEGLNQPLAVQANKCKRVNRNPLESWLSHAPNLSTDYRGTHLGAADSQDFCFVLSAPNGMSRKLTRTANQNIRRRDANGY